MTLEVAVLLKVVLTMVLVVVLVALVVFIVALGVKLPNLLLVSSMLVLVIFA